MSKAYQLHAQGRSSLPHSTFLRFPHLPKNRIIALPAYLGGDEDAAGVKWIASAPENVQRGLERATALIVLNDPETGRPLALLEGSHISAARTAASAALAARLLHDWRPTDSVGLIGCGRINFEIASYLRHVYPDLSTFVLFDIEEKRQVRFSDRLLQALGPVQARAADRLESLLASCRLVSLATTATVPHISDVSVCPPGTTILHVSLRDLTPEVILASDNVVDDFEHVCRAQTSIHLARDLSGRTDFVACSLGEILNGKPFRRSSEAATVVFSPFGLGILDIALGRAVWQRAVARGTEVEVPAFLPLQPWDAAITAGELSRRAATPLG